jgi:hypothetical protein
MPGNELQRRAGTEPERSDPGRPDLCLPVVDLPVGLAEHRLVDQPGLDDASRNGDGDSGPRYLPPTGELAYQQRRRTVQRREDQQPTKEG